jgi:hypothetical protein
MGGIGDRDDLCAIRYRGPGDQMMATHHAGADQANAQGLVHWNCPARSSPVIAENHHALALLSIIERPSARIRLDFGQKRQY